MLLARSHFRRCFAGCLIAVSVAAEANAAVTAVGPFTGALTENSNQYSNVMAVQTLPVFGGFGSLEMLSAGGAIKVEFSSSLSGDLVTPLSGMMTGQLGVAQWVFDEPIGRFGGWFENNSGADNAAVFFYGADGAPVGAAMATIPADAQAWTWNGWEFPVPVSKIVVSGFGLVNGFIWYENMQVDPAVLCPADLDRNGAVDGADLGMLLAAWGTGDAMADLDGSGVVDGADLGGLLAAWGKCGG